MTANDLTDAKLAERVHGLSRSQVCRIRNRTSIPSLSTARKLAVATGIPIEGFLVVERLPPVRSRAA